MTKMTNDQLKNKIWKHWDTDYSELGGVKVEKSWMDNDAMLSRLQIFLMMMQGRIFDGTHHLKDEAKDTEINRIQEEQKDAVWASIQESDLRYSAEENLRFIYDMLKDSQIFKGKE
jgi:hypothetical protein